MDRAVRGDGCLPELIARMAASPAHGDLTRAQARAGLEEVLHVSARPVQAAVFLIALRMKGETDDELLGLLDALLASTPGTSADVEDLVDVSDPYDGFPGGPHAAPFLPAVLSACGVAALSHGVERSGPAHGITHAQVLRAAGADVSLSPRDAAVRLGDPSAGWAYLDQARYCPALYGLAGLRQLMVTSTALSTLERVLGPVRARGRTHLMAGCVRAECARIYTLLARESGFSSALVLRGSDGGVMPAPRLPGQAWAWSGAGEAGCIDFSPQQAGLATEVHVLVRSGEADIEGGAQAAADAGLAALGGAPGAVRDGLVYAGALCLRHLGRHDDLTRAAAAVRVRLDDGTALARFRAGSAAG